MHLRHSQPGRWGPVQQREAATASRSHGQKAELHLGWPSSGRDPFYEEEEDEAAASGPQHFDVLGLGQAMVDFAALAEDGVLERLSVDKGARKIISLEERGSVLEGLDGEAYQVSAGGSLSNSLMALARLGTASEEAAGGAQRRLRVAMAGLVGSDALGSFYQSQMRQAGVEVVATPVAGAHTGTVVVLTSADAQRTMLSYLGTPAEVAVDAALEAAIAASRVLVIEGYLWELPAAAATIGAAIDAAQRHGTVVAMTAGDAGVVQRHGAELWAAIDRGVDVLFTNMGEAAALAACAPGGAGTAPATAEAAALALGPHCSLVAVTDGSAGSAITALGQLYVVPPHWVESPPVDTCGAGDGYAAGLLYGFLRNYDVTAMGRTAARVASAVIARRGGVLGEDAARAVAAHLPAAADRGAFLGGQQQQQQHVAAAVVAER